MIVYEGFVTLEKIGKREIVRTTDSVAFLIADFTHGLAVFVEQSRAPMVRPDNTFGKILEVPAGRRDCPLNVRGLMVKEGGEETGIMLTENDLVFLNAGKPLASSPGVLSERVYLAYIERDLMPHLSGPVKFGVSESEDITRHILSAETLRAMTYDDLKTMLLANWFLGEPDARERSKA